MRLISFSQLVLYFTLYSVMGWICETIWCSIGARKFVNRGFLTGPWCPIYGFGALFIVLLVEPVKNNPVLTFLLSMAVASTLEYFTSWLLEALFQIRWWDYSEKRFNLKGRICAGNSVIFGFMGLIATFCAHPAAEKIVKLLRPEVGRVLASLIFALFTIDLIHTLLSVTRLRERMENLKVIFRELELYQHEYSWYDKSDPKGSVARLRSVCEDSGIDDKSTLILQKIYAIEQRFYNVFRILNAFPKMRPEGLSVELDILRQEWSMKLRAGRDKRYSWFWSFFKKIGCDAITAYQTLTFTHIVWIFLIGGITGYIVETAYCFLTTGIIESRQGMLYGPFSQIYGLGAVMMVLLLMPLSSKRKIWIFCGSAVVGGLFEAGCCLAQEVFFGSVSWQYADHPFAFFGGRTNLFYMFFWGVMGTVYICFLHPNIINFIDRLPKRPKRFFTWVIVIGLSLDMLLSALAVRRWSDRILGIKPQNQFEEFLDRRYPNEMMEEIYPNMEFLHEEK